MKRPLLPILMFLATTAAIAETQPAVTSRPADARAQAAALLSHPHALSAVKADVAPRSLSPVSATMDAHERARALLSGVRPGYRVNAPATIAEPTRGRARADAQAHAAALLSR